jgi:hypothetical protein
MKDTSTELRDSFTGELVGHVTGYHVDGIPSEAEVDALSVLYQQRRAIESGIRGIEDAIRYRAEAAHWRQMYQDMLNSSLRESQRTTAKTLELTLAGCFRVPENKQ